MSNNLNSEVISGSILKLLRHPSFVSRQKTPISTQMVLTNACNLKCVFCINGDKRSTCWSQNKMSKEFAFQIIRDLKDLGNKAIEFTGGGEPLLHDSFEEIVEYTLDLGMDVALVTNGVFLKNVPQKLLERFDWIRVSVNAGRENYKKIHGVDKYDEVMEGLEHINDLGISNKGVSHIFCSSSDIKDTQNLLDDLQKFSIDYFRFSVDVLDSFKISSETLKSEKIPIIDHSERDKKIPKKCGIFYYKPVIDCDGVFYPCCVNQFKRITPLGNAKNIKDIIGDKSILIDTSKCAYCIYRGVNDLIANMDLSIKNINFI